MLGKPVNGWSEITLNGEKIGKASYLEDVPFDVLDSFLSYFQKSENFSVSFDAEDFLFGIFCIFGTLCIVNDDDAVRIVSEKTPSDFSCASEKEMMKALAKEALSDIEDNFEEWVAWPFDFSFMSTKAVEKRRSCLQKKTASLKKALKV